MKIGLVHNWPGAKNSEYDIILRLIDIFDSMGIDSEIVDPIGNVLDENIEYTHLNNEQVDAPDLVLNLHYTNPKFLDGLSYAVNWNPMAYIYLDPNTRQPIPSKQLNFYIDNINSHDRILSAGSDIVDSYAGAARSGKESHWLSPEELTLHTSIDSAESIEPNPIAEESKVFYIGVNWEKVSNSNKRQLRHDGVFEKLDKTGLFRFYGIEKLYGVPLWEGIDSYMGELPFDGGKSIIEKSAECGISLVLSSAQHIESELVSTRIFQACKAGTVILTDDNPFIRKHFADSVYYIDDAKGEDLAEKIINSVARINSNAEEAYRKAQRSQAIFKAHFCLRKEAEFIVEVAQKDSVDKQGYLKDLVEKHSVRVFYSVKELNESHITGLISNLNKQDFGRIALTVICQNSHIKVIKEKLSGLNKYISVRFESGYNKPTLGKVLSKGEFQEQYWLSYSPGFVWKKAHIFELLAMADRADADVINSQLFISYNKYKMNRNPMEYFISGRNGSDICLSRDSVTALDWADFPAGNILINRTQLDAISDESALVSQFDILAPFVILVLNLDKGHQKFISTNKISSYFESAADDVISFDDFLNYESGDNYRKYELNLIGAFFRDDRYLSSVYVAEKVLQWTMEEQEDNEKIHSLGKALVHFLHFEKYGKKQVQNYREPHMVAPFLKKLLNENSYLYQFIRKSYFKIRGLH